MCIAKDPLALRIRRVLSILKLSVQFRTLSSKQVARFKRSSLMGRYCTLRGRNVERVMRRDRVKEMLQLESGHRQMYVLYIVMFLSFRLEF